MPDFSETKEESASKSSDHKTSQTSKGDDVKSIKKRGDFWRGVGLFFGLLIGSYLVVLVLQSIVLPSGTVLSGSIFLFPTAGIVILLIYLAFRRPQMALGLAASMGCSIALLFLMLVALMIIGGGCGFPGC